MQALVGIVSARSCAQCGQVIVLDVPVFVIRQL
jgi:hypothetical protein